MKKKLDRHPPPIFQFFLEPPPPLHFSFFLAPLELIHFDYSYKKKMAAKVPQCWIKLMCFHLQAKVASSDEDSDFGDVSPVAPRMGATTGRARKAVKYNYDEDDDDSDF